jgi:hypothetical protein
MQIFVSRRQRHTEMPYIKTSELASPFIQLLCKNSLTNFPKPKPRLLPVQISYRTETISGRSCDCMISSYRELRSFEPYNRRIINSLPLLRTADPQELSHPLTNVRHLTNCSCKFYMGGNMRRFSIGVACMHGGGCAGELLR